MAVSICVVGFLAAKAMLSGTQGHIQKKFFKANVFWGVSAPLPFPAVSLGLPIGGLEQT